ncbi:MAG: single-stranded DNA-binding protein [Fastidiosipilaceae bacterium]|jgi:single-strand DNA-binding protein
MNTVNLMGRLTKDPAIKTVGEHTVANFTLAVDRGYKDKNTGERQADFINCVAWRSTAEFIEKYFSKGQQMGLVGSIQTRSWDDVEGNKRYATEVNVNNVYFCGSKQNNDGNHANGAGTAEQRSYNPPKQQGKQDNREDYFDSLLAEDQGMPFDL